MAVSMKGRSFVSISDFSVEEVWQVWTLAAELKRKQKVGEPHRILGSFMRTRTDHVDPDARESLDNGWQSINDELHPMIGARRSDKYHAEPLYLRDVL